MKNYSKLGLFKSKGRIFYETPSKYRSPFQRDRDRIIHSASFRRLKHKTQVFVNTEGDHYRTRITHSMEVSQIARSIARYLNLNEDLAETVLWWYASRCKVDRISKKNNEKINKFLTNRFKYLDDQNYETYPSNCIN